VWDSNVLALGEFPVGEFDATVSFDRVDSGATLRSTLLRDPYKTKITIEAGGEARLVVR
jgi:hypothetical protein